MAPEPRERDPLEPTPDFRQALSNLSNRDLLSALDLTLLELERRLYRYAHEGEEIIDMADEGLLLASRAQARLGQAIFGGRAHRGSPAGGRGGRVESHEHPPLVGRRATSY